ncbi:MAG: transcriptional regulator [Terracidiphilus sp.]
MIFNQLLRLVDRRARIPLLLFCLLRTAVLPAQGSPQGSWSVAGPDGGDARAFAAVPGQPAHLYLGTTNSWLYESKDEGSTWHRLAKLDPADGFVLDSIVVDAANPTSLFVGGWKNSDDGGLWMSGDGGRTWTENAQFKGKPVHALAQAPSNPQVLIAGTLEGVFRSNDAGETWTKISPEGSREIHNIESLAIDPRNPDIVYAGTWHLPWKTADGGKTWHNIKQGLIVDSDVFSIIVDPVHSKVVYLSACSGIYKSENGGLLFRKIQGIPSEARRTRSLEQDPQNHDVVYAGTTEGLYKTVNAGKTFARMTDENVVVNDVYVDPADSNRVLLATDRSGVLASHDAGVGFSASNQGISERKVAALLVDHSDPNRFYAGVVNDKTYGGVFRSNDSGEHWEQLGAGLDGRDVYSLAQAKNGAIVAGTSHGIFVLDPSAISDPPPTGVEDSPPASDGLSGASHDALTWQPRNTIANTVMKVSTETVRGTHVNIEKQVKAAVIELQSPVNALDVSGDVWVAATGYGLVTSRDQGANWQGGPVMGLGDYLTVAVNGESFVAARNDSVVISKDSGQTWWPMGVPTMLTHIHRVAFSPDGTLWLGAREGLYYTRDLGKSWMWIQRLPLRDVDDLSFDASSHKLLASSRLSDVVYAIDPKTMKWDWWQTGYPIDLIRCAGDRLVAASLDDGVLLGPRTAPAQPDRSAGVTAKQ